MIAKLSYLIKRTFNDEHATIIKKTQKYEV